MGRRGKGNVVLTSHNHIVVVGLCALYIPLSKTPASFKKRLRRIIIFADNTKSEVCVLYFFPIYLR